MKLGRASFWTASFPTLLSTALVLLTLNSCSRPMSIVGVERSQTLTGSAVPTSQVSPCSTRGAALWSGGFENANWMKFWGVRDRQSWGRGNIKVPSEPSNRFSKVLRVNYPAGSASPTATQDYKTPVGGGQFFADLGMIPKDSLCLSYYVRFSNDFAFVKGGKLPGLFGGTINDGRKIPDGTNGFSTRYMWRSNGDGEVYAYLPTSREHGTSIDRGSWRFRPGTWHHLEQEVVLNQPSKKDGRIRVWFDGEQVLDKGGLIFRTTQTLKIEGILFSTFFGGGDRSWATPKTVYADFANFAVYSP